MTGYIIKKILIVIVFLVGAATLIGIASSSDDTEISDSQLTQSTDNSSITNSMYARITGDEFDKAYLADMIAHHLGALNMASYARSETSREQIKDFSEGLLSSQSKEVQQMLEWQKAWGYVDGSDPHAGHAMEAVGDMGAEMAAMEAKLYDLTGLTFDQEFLTQMILHHQQAIDISKHAATNSQHQELKDLAKSIISTQEKEIADMKRWQREWGY